LNTYGFTNSGTAIVDYTAQILVTGPDGSFTNYNSGTNTLTGGTYDITGTLQVAGGINVVNIASGTNVDLIGAYALITPDGSTNGMVNLASNAGNLTLDGSQLTLTGALSNSGSVTLTGNSYQVGTPPSGGSYAEESYLSVPGTFTNSGTVTLQGNTAQFSYGPELAVGGNFNNSTGGDLEVLGSSYYYNYSLPSATVSGNFNNSGIVHVGSGPAMQGAALIVNGTFTDNTGGMVTIDAGGYTNASLTVQNGNPYVEAGGTTTVNGGLYATNTNVTGGTLQGTGTVHGNVNVSAGTIMGGTLSTPGTLNITGNYNQTGGAYNEVINSMSSNGLLNIGGTITLGAGATLDITLLGSYDPTDGTSFIIADQAGTPSGTFTINPADLYFGAGNSQTWSIAYNSTDVVLEAVSSVSGQITADWTTGTGNWTTASEWSCSPGPPTCVPDNFGATTYAVGLNAPGYELTIPAGDSETVSSLTLQGGTLDIPSTASLNVLNNGLTDIPQGAGLIVAGSFTNGANQALYQLNSVEGYLELDAQSLTDTPGSGTLTISSTGAISLNDGTLFTVDGNLANNGAFYINDAGSTVTVNGNLTNSNLLEVNGGSTLAVTGNLTNTSAFYTGNGAGGNTLTVGGTFTNSGYAYIGYSGVSGDVANVNALVNTGYLYIGSSATLNITGGGPGVTDVVAGSSIYLYGTFELGGVPADSALASLNSVEGFLELGNGQTTADTPGSGTLTVSNTGQLRVDYGTTLNVTGNMTNSGYVYTGVSGGAANTLTVSGAYTNNAGAQTWVGYNGSADNMNVNSLTNDGYLVIGGNATMTITGGGPGVTDVVAGSTILLYGTLQVDPGPPTNGLANLNSVEGYLDIANGQTTNDTPGSGTLTVSNSGDLRLDYGSTLNVTGNMSNSGYVYMGVNGGAGNTLTVSGAYANNAGAQTYIGYDNTADNMKVNSLTNDGYLWIGPNATFNISGGGSGVTDVVAGSTIDLYGTFELSGNSANSALANLNSVEGNLYIQNGQTTGMTPGSGTLTISGSGSMEVNNGSTVSVTGNLTNSNGLYTGVGGGPANTLSVSGAFTNNYVTYVGYSDASADQMNVGSLANNNFIWIGYGASLNIAGSTDTNAGTIQIYGGTLNSPSAGGNFVNTGTVETYGYPGTVTIGGTFSNQAGGNLNLNVSGDKATMPTLANGGTVNVASGALLGVGTGTFSGSGYQQLANGTLDEELTSGSSFGVINVNGAASLGSGTLDVTLEGGFMPTNGETFDILNFTAGDLSGQFSNGTSFMQDGYTWTLTYNDAGGFVQLTAGTAPGLVAATWTTSSGNWTNPAEWGCTPAYTPCVPDNNGTTSFTATVNSPGQELTLDSTSTPTSITINSLSLVAGTLNIGSGASLNLVDQASGITDIPVNAGLIVAGTFTAGANNALYELQSVEGGLTLVGQSLGDTPGSGTLTNTGTVNLQQTTAMTVTGNVDNLGTINTGNGSSDTGSNSLAVSGNLTTQGGVWMWGNHDSLNVGGALTITNTGVLYQIGSDTSVTAGALNNLGQLIMYGPRYAATGNSLTTANWINLNGSGELSGGGYYEIGGTLEYTSPASGIITIDSGITLIMDPGGFITPDGVTDALAGLASNAGNLQLVDYPETFTPAGSPGTFSNTGDLYLYNDSGSTLALTVNGNFTNSNYTELDDTNGTSPQNLIVTGNSVNSGTIAMYGNNDSFSTTGTLTNSGAIDMYGVGDSLSFDLTNSGSIYMGANGQSLNDAGVFTNLSSGSLTLAGTNDTVTVAGAFSNDGTITIYGPYNGVSGNTVTVNSWSNLDGSGNLSGTGTYNIGGKFQYGNGLQGGVVNIGSGVAISLYPSGLITPDGTSDGLAGLTNNAGTLGLYDYNESITPGAPGTFTNSGTLYIYNDNYNGSLPSTGLTVNGNFDNAATGTTQLWDNNFPAGEYLSVTGNSSNEGTIAMFDEANFTTTGTLTNSGNIDMYGADSTLNADLTNTGTIWMGGANDVLTDSGDFNNNVGGSLQLAASHNLVNVAGAFNNGGSVNLSGTTDTLSATSFANTGNVAISTGNSIVATGMAGYSQTAGSTQGTGTIKALVGGVTISGGTIQPGTPGAPGTLAISGNYTQGSGGTLVIDLGGTGAGDYGVLSVSGSASLDGTVDFQAIGSFVPHAGEDFTFLTFGDGETGTLAMDFTGNWSGCPVGDTCTDVLGSDTLTLEIKPTVVTTPEPSSFLLLVLGIAAMTLLLKYRNAVRVQ
jgi:hypothetical protein